MKKKISFYDFLCGVRFLLNLAFGKCQCERCGNSAPRGFLCRNCRTALLSVPRKILKKKRCEICGRILLSEKNLCFECRENRVIFSADKIFSILPYRTWRKNLLFQWKMNEERSLSVFFAELCKIAMDEFFGEIAVVPVPPRKGKIREKGWDQIDEICRILNAKFGVKILPLLQRTSSAEQKKLNRLERLNTKGSSYVSAKNAESVYEKSGSPAEVLLLDDVLTTGATVETCAGVLKKIGVPRVHVLTMFIVD